MYDLSVSEMLHPVLWTVLIVLATYRATRIVTRDKLPVIGLPREAFVQRWGIFDEAVGDERKISIGGRETNVVMSSLAYLWECDWCMSIWIGAGITYLTYLWPETMLWVTLALVASAVTGWLAQFESLLDKKFK